jgi:Holliday junction resolvase
MGKSERQKGARGERELIKVLEAAGFGKGRRTPGSGGQGIAGDLWNVLPEWHIECKRQERLNIPSWIKQATEDSAHDGRPWFVAFRRNKEPWYVTLELEEFIRLLKDND